MPELSIHTSFGYTFDDRIEEIQRDGARTQGAALYVEQTEGVGGLSYNIKPILPSSRLGRWLHARSFLFNRIYTAIVKLGLHLRDRSVLFLETKASGNDPYGSGGSVDSLKLRITGELDHDHPLVPRIYINMLAETPSQSCLSIVVEDLERSMSLNPGTLQEDALMQICCSMQAREMPAHTEYSWGRCLDVVGAEIASRFSDNESLKTTWCMAVQAFRPSERLHSNSSVLESLGERMRAWLPPSDIRRLTETVQSLTRETARPQQALNEIECYLSHHSDQLEHNSSLVENVLQAVLERAGTYPNSVASIVSILTHEDRGENVRNAARQTLRNAQLSNSDPVRIHALVCREILRAMTDQSMLSFSQQRSLRRVLANEPSTFTNADLLQLEPIARLSGYPNLYEDLVTVCVSRQDLPEFMEQIEQSVRATWPDGLVSPAVLDALYQRVSPADPFRQELLLANLSRSGTTVRTLLLLTQISDLVGENGSLVDFASLSTVVRAGATPITNDPGAAWWNELFQRVLEGIQSCDDASERNSMVDSLVRDLEENRGSYLENRGVVLFTLTERLLASDLCAASLTGRVRSLREAALQELLRDAEAMEQLDETTRDEVIRLSYWRNAGSRFRAGQNQYSFAIRENDISADPERVLQEFYRHCYHGYPATSSMRVDFLTDTLQSGRGYDAGGLSRHFISTLFSSLDEKARAAGGLELLSFDTSLLDGILPKASSHTPIYNWRRYDVDRRTDEELLDAAIFTYNVPGVAPAEMRTADGNWDLVGIRENWGALQLRLPVLSHQELQAYEAMGKFMGMCYRSNGRLLTGQVFSSVLFDIIRTIAPANLDTHFEALPNEQVIAMYEATLTESDGAVRQQIAWAREEQDLTEMVPYYVDWKVWPEALRQGYDLDGDDEPPHPTLEQIQAHGDAFRAALTAQLVANARNASGVAPAFAMAKGMRHHFQQHGVVTWPESSAVMSGRIQGEFSKDVVIAAIPEVEGSLGDYFRQWIRESADAQVKLLLKAITGAESLAAGQRLAIATARGWSERRPMAFHTCSRQIDCASRYTSYERFKETLEFSIQNAMGNSDTMQVM